MSFWRSFFRLSVRAVTVGSVMYSGTLIAMIGPSYYLATMAFINLGGFDFVMLFL